MQRVAAWAGERGIATLRHDALIQRLHAAVPYLQAVTRQQLRTKTEAGTRCWLYAHLIVALLSDDLSQDFLESFPSGAS